jgi:hypothetical protein
MDFQSLPGWVWAASSLRSLSAAQHQDRHACQKNHCGLGQTAVRIVDIVEGNWVSPKVTIFTLIQTQFIPRRWTWYPSQCWGYECCLPRVLPSIFSWLPSCFSFKVRVSHFLFPPSLYYAVYGERRFRSGNKPRNIGKGETHRDILRINKIGSLKLSIASHLLLSFYFKPDSPITYYKVLSIF